MKTLSKSVKWTLSAALTVGAAGFLSRPALADALPGPMVANSEVLANSADSYEFKFIGGEQAQVTIVGDGDTVLHAYVYDENGNRVASDTDGDGTGGILMRWTPSWTGNFRVRIVNTGNVYNHYRLRTN